MAKFFNSDLSDLTHQLTLSPRRLRMEQIHAIEELLGMVEPSRAYPYEFICHRITKFQKHGGTAAGASVPGKALIDDLVTMAEVLSRKANLGVLELDESFKLHQEAADALHVSTKTVRRWRSRGLMGIRAVCEDGVNRLVFLRSTLDRFVKQNQDLVAKGAAFKQLTQIERDHLVDRAREILRAKTLKLHTIARTIAEETGRAVETVRYTLRRYDESNPETALFVGPAKSAACRREEAIWHCRESGESIEAIARAYECDPADIHLVLRQVEVRRWRESPPEYIHNEIFAAPGADAIVLEVSEPPARSDKLPAVPKGLPTYLRALYRTPLLTAEQEQDLFRRYNYLKYKSARMIAKIDADEPVAGACDEVRSLTDKADEIRRRIVEANLRLVVSIAKKHVGWSPNFFEVISDGNVSLMRAVEKFDYARGYKFSTYATWAVMKNYARSIPTQHYYTTRFVTGQDLVLDSAPDHNETPVLQSDNRTVRAKIAEALAKLTERERTIVSGHFGLARAGTAATLEELGKVFGVTKERVRQIEKRALAQLREILAPSLIDAISS